MPNFDLFCEEYGHYAYIQIHANVHRNILTNQNHFSPFVAVPTPAISTDISTSGSLVAGSEFKLTCVVSELIPGLTDMPDVMWVRAAGDVVPGTVSVTRADGMAVAVLTFDPVRTSYSGGYTCTGSLASPTKLSPFEVSQRMEIIFRSKLVLLMQPSLNSCHTNFMHIESVVYLYNLYCSYGSKYNLKHKHFLI